MALTKITGEGVGTLAGDTTTLTLEDTSSHSANTGPAISFKSKDSGETTREVAKIVGESHSGSNEGNLAFQTRNGGTLETKWKVFKNGNLLPSNSSYGIYLGTTSAAEANLLDDYEEGTWTPTVLNGWGILNPTYSTNTGYYTKIGNLVHVLFKIILSGGSTNGNPLVIHGLPYNSNATTGGSGIYHTLHGSFSTASSNATSVFMKVGSNNTNNAQAFYKTSSGEANFTGTNAGGSFNCTFSGIYRTDL